ncbi:MAG: apolipoprotein N-acyltransferase [Propionibacteriaceae bacterium]|jgi:apolipoprotein N-acyltransferase|nr:apolipoprotein N-acyltransferase [Propionibacteriaceae bacterium]
MDTKPGRPNPWLFAGLALAGGVVTGLGFAPYDLWWLVPIGVATMVVTTQTASPGIGALRGYLYGFGFNLVAFRWITAFGMPAILFVFVAWLAVWYALVGLVIAATRKTAVWGVAGVAAWMGAEWAGARWPFGGFGWGRLAYSAVDTPIDGLFPIISATGVSFIIVTCGFLLAWIVVRVIRRSPRSWPQWASQLVELPVIGLVAVVLVAAVGGAFGRGYDPGSPGDPVNIGVVQGNVPGTGVEALGPRYTVENNHLAETIILAAKIRTGQVSAPDFVAWPENSAATDALRDEHTAHIIDTAVDLVQVPILAGAIVAGPGDDERQTVGLWWTPRDGVTASYAKRNLVPFGEWIPFRSLVVSLIPVLERVGAQSVPGDSPGVLDVLVDGRGLRVGDLICFEVSYDDTFDQMITGDPSTGGGAQVIVVQTSNAMFTGSDQMAQQDRITRVRAMEARREIVVSTTNSLAGLIDSHGRVVYQSELSHSDATVFEVPRRVEVTLAVAWRRGYDLASVLVPMMIGAGVLIASRRGHRHARLDGSGEAASSRSAVASATDGRG